MPHTPDDPKFRRNVPTVPEDPRRPPRFGQPVQLAKDVFTYELRKFLDARNTGRGEIVNVRKYSVSVDTNRDPLATAVDLFRAYPDIVESLPLIAVMSATGKNSRLDLGIRYVGPVQYPPKVVGTAAGPFALEDGDFIVLDTNPGGNSPQRTHLQFQRSMFVNIGAATLEEVIAAVGLQALYIKAKATSDGHLQLETGGLFGAVTPNFIRVVDGSANALSAFGLSIGQADDSTDAGKVVYHRYYASSTLTVALEVATESDQTRTELTDVVYDFFTFVMADRQFTFLGRSTFDDSVTDETYQIIIQDAEVSISGEQEVPRSGDLSDKIYVNRVNVPVHVIQYVDRVATDARGTPIRPFVRPEAEFDGSMPMPN